MLSSILDWNTTLSYWESDPPLFLLLFLISSTNLSVFDSNLSVYIIAISKDYIW